MSGGWRNLRPAWRNWLAWIAGVAGVLIGGLVARALLRKSNPVLSDVRRELDAVAAERVAAKAVAEAGRAVALVRVEQDHARALAALDAAQADEAVSLRADPQKLAGFLVRAARGSDAGSGSS